MSTDSLYEEDSSGTQIEALEKKLKFKARLELFSNLFTYPFHIDNDANYSIALPVKELFDSVDKAILTFGMNGEVEYSFRREVFKRVVSTAIVVAGGLHERFRDDEIAMVLRSANDYAQKHFSDELRAKTFWKDILDPV